MPTARVIEALDEFKDGQARFGVRLEATPIKQLAFEVAKKLSAMALS
jgi:hypothetical protein